MAQRILQLSDVHLTDRANGAPDSADRTLERVLDAVGEGPFDLVVLTGDLSDDASVGALRRLWRAIAQLGCPVLATPGNHDDRGAVRSVFGNECMWRGGGWRVAALDTTIPRCVEGRVELVALRELLGRDEGVPTVLALHHPPITTSRQSAFQLCGATDLVRELAGRSDVRAVLSGHLHEAFHVHLGEVAYLGAPSTWYGLSHRGLDMKRTDEPPGATLITLEDDGEIDWTRISA